MSRSRITLDARRLWIFGAVLLLIGCRPTGDAFVRAVNQKFPVQSKQVIVSNGRVNGVPLDADKPLTVRPGETFVVAADLLAGEWGLSKLGEVWDELVLPGNRPETNVADRSLVFMSFIRSPSQLSYPTIAEPKLMMSRFKSGGKSGELKVSLQSPKQPGTYTVEIICADSSGLAKTSEEMAFPVFRAVIKVQ